MDKKNVPYIFLLTHGEWGRELIKSTEMIVGKLERIISFSLMPDNSLEYYTNQIKEQIEEHKDEGVILISDIYGGTTFNIAGVLSCSYSLHSINGLSMDMLVIIDELRGELEVDVLIDNVLNRLKERNCNIKNKIETNLNLEY